MKTIPLTKTMKKGARDINGIGYAIIQKVYGGTIGGHVLILPNQSSAKVYCRSCGSKPKESYKVGVPHYDINSKCDYFMFARMKGDWKTGWCLGHIETWKFREQCEKEPAGTYDPVNRHVTQFDNFVMRISDLERPRRFK